MTDSTIIKIELDETTIQRRDPRMEHEKRTAILDIIEFNSFACDPAFANIAGPYHITIKLIEKRLCFVIANNDERANFKEIYLSLSSFKKIIKDYLDIINSYYNAISHYTAAQIETIDMARKAIHDEAAELLTERLKGKVIFDKMTARRLFSLIAVLHMDELDG